ncbi:MAG: squalene synthase HpnC [Solirubrobacteraceae bacterium]
MGAGQAPSRLKAPATLEASAIMARAFSENFPVALRLLATQQRERLLAIYGFARLCDEIGDSPEGAPADRLEALDWLQAELESAYAGTASHPLMSRLQQILEHCPLPREPFVRLIEANRMDQQISRYETWEQLRSYCHLSADPVGELVLAAFDCSSSERIALSDEICTALQLTEHLQDIGEDMRRGRVYLPADEMRRFGVSETDLRAANTTPALAALIAFQLTRAEALFDAGAPLIQTLKGRPRLAVAAFLGGGRSALSAIAGAGYEVLAGQPRPQTLQGLTATLAALLGRRRR